MQRICSLFLADAARHVIRFLFVWGRSLPSILSSASETHVQLDSGWVIELASQLHSMFCL
uniref:Uncharacterized protein n=1 Tax=Anguilla anguilla TaxID=7936 RepID=A0A0E9W459_ANGAN